ncbi:hypothetical protein D3C78_1985990 [compost metagenome]
MDEPVSMGVSSVVDGITFYMEDKDLWYLDGYRLNVAFDEAEGDIEYKYETAD